MHVVRIFDKIAPPTIHTCMISKNFVIILFVVLSTSILITHIELVHHLCSHYCYETWWWWNLHESNISLSRAHAQGVMWSVLSVVSTKIARSGDVGMWATLKYNVPINIAEKLASVCFESFGKAHERCKYCVLLATPMDTAHYVLSAHAYAQPGTINTGVCR